MWHCVPVMDFQYFVRLGMCDMKYPEIRFPMGKHVGDEPRWGILADRAPMTMDITYVFPSKDSCPYLFRLTRVASVAVCDSP